MTLHQRSEDGRDAAATLYVGEVMHARMRPATHRFQYRVMSLLVDVGRLKEADRQSALFGINRRALYSFHERDHGRRDGSSLLAYARDCAAEHGIDLDGGRVLLLCYPRLLGYVFNPLSVYFCYRSDGALALMIYEVRNTFGEINAYVLPVKPNEMSAAGLRQSQDKTFYVSPFIDMAMRYHFRVTPPGDNVKLRILETSADGPLLAATFFGCRRSLTSRSLLAAFLSLPLVTLKIFAAIHWEALRLWAKGVRLVPRGEIAASAGTITGLARNDSHAYISRR
ncbi:DUF1365 domain-containing protein [Bradyrhizobium sp. HKCCYLS20291]|uniref:DUF1365 domain-containing protein n=1 Tax=Bradyrhizobium sp. HKCCYLS20291 TaxID=3420766 RepID=UPI003EB7F7FB